MRGVTCGLWPCRRGVAVVIVDEEGRTIWSALVARSRDDEWNLLLRIGAEVGLDCELVLPEWLARTEPIAVHARTRGIAVWVVPSALVESVRLVGRLGAGPPARTAAALARLPLAPALRGMLRRHAPPDTRQLSILP